MPYHPYTDFKIEHQEGQFLLTYKELGRPAERKFDTEEEAEQALSDLSSIVDH